jgi:hypothetical protein
MQSMETQLVLERRDERLQVRDWRRAQLRRAGFDARDADVLALATAVDLHQAIGLVRRGCSSATAVKILL